MARPKKVITDNESTETNEVTEVTEVTVNPCVCGNKKKPEFCTNCN